MEIIVKNIQVYPRTCVGCVTQNRDIMVAVLDKQSDRDDIHDVFLTTEQAEQLVRDLQDRLKTNLEKPVPTILVPASPAPDIILPTQRWSVMFVAKDGTKHPIRLMFEAAVSVLAARAQAEEYLEKNSRWLSGIDSIRPAEKDSR